MGPSAPPRSAPETACCYLVCRLRQTYKASRDRLAATLRADLDWPTVSMSDQRTFRDRLRKSLKPAPGSFETPHAGTTCFRKKTLAMRPPRRVRPVRRTVPAPRSKAPVSPCVPQFAVGRAPGESADPRRLSRGKTCEPSRASRRRGFGADPWASRVSPAGPRRPRRTSVRETRAVRRVPAPGSRVGTPSSRAVPRRGTGSPSGSRRPSARG